MISEMRVIWYRPAQLENKTWLVPVSLDHDWLTMGDPAIAKIEKVGPDAWEIEVLGLDLPRNEYGSESEAKNEVVKLLGLRA